jgi:diguanylate cyclase (GGDEF)-like protein
MMRHDVAPTWLAPSTAHRDRLLDMERRLKPVRAAAMGLLALALVACGPWMGFWTLLPLGIATAGFVVVDRGIEASSTPEHRIAAAWVLSMVAIAGAVAASGGPGTPTVSWLVIPVVTLPARFGTRGLVAGAVFAAACMVATTLGVDAGAVADAPQLLVAPLAMLGAIATLSVALMQSDLHHRSAAVIDPLTGMLNRGALITRSAELAQQAAFVHQPIALIVGDLDRFKSINDGHGHAAGDAVLQEVAYRLRKHLRAFDLAYRIGGEEFLVVMPGADDDQAIAIAEQLRVAVRDAPAAGLHVTVSFGVASSQPGSFDFEDVFARADAALYAAKAAGRDQVKVDGDALVAVPE